MSATLQVFPKEDLPNKPDSVFLLACIFRYMWSNRAIQILEPSQLLFCTIRVDTGELRNTRIAQLLTVMLQSSKFRAQHAEFTYLKRTTQNMTLKYVISEK